MDLFKIKRKRLILVLRDFGFFFMLFLNPLWVIIVAVLSRQKVSFAPFLPLVWLTNLKLYIFYF